MSTTWSSGSSIEPELNGREFLTPATRASLEAMQRGEGLVAKSCVDCAAEYVVSKRGAFHSSRCPECHRSRKNAKSRDAWHKKHNPGGATDGRPAES